MASIIEAMTDTMTAQAVVYVKQYHTFLTTVYRKYIKWKNYKLPIFILA
jgi:hypothetical protein